MVLSTLSFTKIIRTSLLFQLGCYRLGLWPAGGGAGGGKSPGWGQQHPLRKGKGLRGPGTAPSPFRKAKQGGGPIRKGAEPEGSPWTKFGINRTNYDNCTPLQYSCLANPMDRGAWWAAVRGVTKIRTRLSDFTFSFHFHALEKEMATHSSVRAWRIPGMGELGGLPSMGLHRVGHDWSDLAAVAKTWSN